jgi:hypothetical protein
LAQNTPEGFKRADPKKINEYSNNVLHYEIEKSGPRDFGGVREQVSPESEERPMPKNS